MTFDYSKGYGRTPHAIIDQLLGEDLDARLFLLILRRVHFPGKVLSEYERTLGLAVGDAFITQRGAAEVLKTTPDRIQGGLARLRKRSMITTRIPQGIPQPPTIVTLCGYDGNQKSDQAESRSHEKHPAANPAANPAAESRSELARSSSVDPWIDVANPAAESRKPARSASRRSRSGSGSEIGIDRLARTRGEREKRSPSARASGSGSTQKAPDDERSEAELDLVDAGAWNYAGQRYAELLALGFHAQPWPFAITGDVAKHLRACTVSLIERWGLASGQGKRDFLIKWHRHRIDVAFAEAHRYDVAGCGDVRSLPFFTPSMLWRKDQFERAVETTVEHASEPRRRRAS